MLPFPFVSDGTALLVASFNAGTLTAPLVMPTELFSAQVPVEDGVGGSKVLKGVRIFKAGQFRDSRGILRTWEPADLVKMAQNYRHLSDLGAFQNVPIRADHTSSVKDVVGYFQSVYVDPSDGNYLCADLQITEPDAFVKWQRGTFRSRSLEVGMYQTNDGQAFYPAVMGLAFVDIPAVEGLHGQHVPSMNFSHVVVDKENSVPPDINTDPEGWKRAVLYAAWVQAANYAQACVDWEKAVTYAAALEAQFQNPPPPAPPAPPAPGNVTPPAPVGTPAPMNFRVNGGMTQDYAQVQSHIDALEGSLAEIALQTRTDFVKKLAEDRKIAVTQVPGLTGLAITMTPSQFQAFRDGYESAPAAPLFAQHAGSQIDPVTQMPPAPGSVEASADQKAVDEEIISNFKRTGMSQEQIEKTSAYQRLHPKS